MTSQEVRGCSLPDAVAVAEDRLPALVWDPASGALARETVEHLRRIGASGELFREAGVDFRCESGDSRELPEAAVGETLHDRRRECERIRESGGRVVCGGEAQAVDALGGVARQDDLATVGVDARSIALQNLACFARRQREIGRCEFNPADRRRVGEQPVADGHR